MKVAWFTPPISKPFWRGGYNYDKMSASVWIRCLQLLPELERKGVDVELNRDCPDVQAAVFLRDWSPARLAAAKRLKAKGARIVVDTPVNYFSEQDLPEFAGGVRDDFRRMLELADMVVCPSEFIAGRGRMEGSPTACVEDAVDAGHFKFRRSSASSNSPTLVWCGVAVKAAPLNALASPIRRNGWKVIVISERRPDLDFPFEYRKWSYGKFPQDIVSGDIGIFPRTADNDYDRGHSFFKIGVFLAEHVPVVASSVPSYVAVATSSNSVLLEGIDPDEWESAIRRMAGGGFVPDFSVNPVDGYGVGEIAGKYASIFQRLLEEGGFA